MNVRRLRIRNSPPLRQKKIGGWPRSRPNENWGAPGPDFGTWVLSRPVERLDLGLLLLGCLTHIVAGLQLIPDFSVGSQRGGKTQRPIGGDACLAVEHAGKRCARNLQMPGGSRYVDVA